MRQKIVFCCLLAALTVAAGPVLAQPTTGFLSAVHGISGLPMPVDVIISGPIDAEFSFDFGDVFGPAEVPTGDYMISVELDGTEVLSGMATVEAGGNYTAVAHFNADATGIALSIFENEVSRLRWWFGRLQIHHLAAAPAVDASIRRGWSRWPKVELSGLSNGEQATATDISAGNYNVGLLAEDNEVFNTGKFRLRWRDNLAVYAVGIFPDTFELIYLPLN